MAVEQVSGCESQKDAPGDRDAKMPVKPNPARTHKLQLLQPTAAIIASSQIELKRIS